MPDIGSLSPPPPPPPIEAAARIVARSVLSDGRAAELLDVHGGGAFSVTFPDAAALAAFVARPTYAPVVFCDPEAVEARLGDVAAGAVRRVPARYDVVVVVALVAQNQRLVLRGSDDTQPLVEQVELEVREVPVEQEARPMTDERVVAVDALARQRARTLDSGERHLLVARDDELDNEDSFDVVAAGEFDEFVRQIAGSDDAEPPESIAHLVSVWREHNPDTHVVVWVLNTDGQQHVDELWVCSRRQPDADDE